MSSDSAGGSVGRRVPLDSAIKEFERFLLVSKGVSVVTQECYVRHVRAMLVEVRGATGAVDFGSLPAGWVRSYVTQLGGRYAPQSMKLMATAVRAFLRCAWLSGWTASDLTGAVGPVITRRSGRLPRALAAEDLHRLLASPDRRTMVGLRDYALLMLLSRLGLRAGEVAGLRLDDFDWPAALVTAKVKGGGRLRLPIPADVGPAVVAYLRRRPAGATCRELFVQVRGAPRPMNSRAVTQVVARHAARVGLGVVRAHRLRHSAARAVLVAGGSLLEVGELLGHANAQVSQMYASFDQPSLAVLVRPWPQGGWS
jgi:site-specific recombinase XerC